MTFTLSLVDFLSPLHPLVSDFLTSFPVKTKKKAKILAQFFGNKIFELYRDRCNNKRNPYQLLAIIKYFQSGKDMPSKQRRW